MNVSTLDIKELSSVLCKLDLEKAYDRVEWSFLSHLMMRMGFWGRWRSWIMECISSARYFILINGTPKGFFQAKRGLLEGGPLSPFLFDIVVEALSSMISLVGEANLISVFRPAVNGPKITHLQFADVTLVFCEANEGQIKYVVAILRCFGAISGLKVIFFKSELIGISYYHGLQGRFASFVISGLAALHC